MTVRDVVPHDAEAEERYRVLVELSPDGILVHRGGSYVFANQAALHLFGATREEEVVGRDVISLIHPDDRGNISRRMESMSAGVKRVPLREARLMRMDGSYLPVEASAAPIIYDGSPSIQVVIRDISDRKESQRRAALLDAVLRNMPIGVAIAEAPSGRLVFPTGPGVVRSDVSSAALRGFEDSDNQPPAFREDGTQYGTEDWPLARALTAGETVTGEEIRFRQADSEDKVMRVSAAPIRDSVGALMAAVVTYEDITESRRTREALRASEERFRLATEVASEAIWDWNLADDTVSWSTAYATLFGGTPEVPSTPRWWYEHLHPEDYDRVVSGIRESIEGTAASWASEYRLQRADGRWANVIDRAVIVRDKSGKALRMIGALLDISIRTRALADVAALNRDLRHKVTELEAIISTVPVGIAIAEDNQALHIRGNPLLLAMLGTASVEELSTNDALTPHPTHYHFMKAGKELAVDELPMHMAARGQEVRSDEFEILRQDGTTIWCLASAAPLYDEKGASTGVVGAFRDITDLKRAHEALGRARDELEQKVQERTRNLRRLNQTLRMISECNQALFQAANERSLVQTICSILKVEGGYRMAWVGYAERAEPYRVLPIASAGFEDGYLDTIAVTWDDSPRGRGPTGTAVRTGEASIGRDFKKDPALAPWRAEALRRGFRSSIALPLFAEGTTFGALTLYAARPNAFGQAEMDLLGELADDLAFGITALRARAERDQAYVRLERSATQLRALTLKVAAAEEQERRRLAHVLHDHVQQLLAGARYGLESTRECTDEETLRATLTRVDGMLDECMEVSRSLTMELSPPVLYDAGLGPALEWLGLWYQEKQGLAVTLTLDERVTIEEASVRIVLFQAVRELLFNVVKHAGVKTANVCSTIGADGRARIVVSDTGVGCDPERASGGTGQASGLGLFGIRERLEALGGALEIDSAPGCGSRFTLVVPSPRRT